MNERDLTADEIRAEHLREVDERSHWLYLFGVLIGGTIAMIALVALLDALA